MDDSALLDGSFASNSPTTYTSVSSALHRERCFQIQSEILNVTMRADFAMTFDSLSDWRSYILTKLEHWKSQLQEAADSDSKSPTDERWILIVYNHCLLYLHIPTKSNVRGPAGDWSMKASTQTILIFRKFQGYRTIPHPMLGVSGSSHLRRITLTCSSLSVSSRSESQFYIVFGRLRRSSGRKHTIPSTSSKQSGPVQIISLS